jgi:UDP-N-acetylglucosamine 2-epimerase
MDAIKARKDVELLVVAGGAHLLPPARTIREVEAAYDVAAKVPMQRPGRTGRDADAAALGRGVSGFAKAFAELKPEWVVVLGDRIEALAAAAAASVAGIAVCHIHGGDRAEGIADEAMRHAITKLAHLHCAATKQSAERIVRMGERPEFVHVTGSPAIDGLDRIKPMGDAEAAELGDPRVVVLLHPAGLGGATRASLPSSLTPAFVNAQAGRRVMPPAPMTSAIFPDDGRAEERFASFTAFVPPCLPDEPPLGPCRNVGDTPCGGVGPRTLVLHPNHDPGHEQILGVFRKWSRIHGWPLLPHLPRTTFIALLKRMVERKRGLLVGNSSAGLIECAALGVPALNLGPRQAGRERDRNVVDADPLDTKGVVSKVRRADRLAGRLAPSKRFGDGRAGRRVAELLAGTDPGDPALLRKRNAY